MARNDIVTGFLCAACGEATDNPRWFSGNAYCLLCAENFFNPHPPPQDSYLDDHKLIRQLTGRLIELENRVETLEKHRSD